MIEEELKEKKEDRRDISFCSLQSQRWLFFFLLDLAAVFCSCKVAREFEEGAVAAVMGFVWKIGKRHSCASVGGMGYLLWLQPKNQHKKISWGLWDDMCKLGKERKERRREGGRI